MREDKVGDREVVRDEEECQDGGKESDVDDEEAQEGEQDEEYGQESDVDMAEDELEFRVDGLQDEEADTKIQTPLPDLVGGVEDREIFKKEQGEDKTLSKLMAWANDNEKGFAWDDGLLVNYLDTPANITWKRIVVPMGRRKEILKLAHCSLLGGHFSRTKTTQLLNRIFTWPRMSIDVKSLCKQCTTCQKAGRVGGKAPLHSNLHLIW